MTNTETRIQLLIQQACSFEEAKALVEITDKASRNLPHYVSDEERTIQASGN